MEKRAELVQLGVQLEGASLLLTDSVAMSILFALASGERRYSELKLGVSSKTLSLRLKSLERKGCITRTLYAEVPPRAVYALTPKGSELLSLLQGLRTWEQSWQKE